MATALGLPFLGGGVRLGGLRGFGAGRAPLPASPPRSLLTSTGDDVPASSSSSAEASGGRPSRASAPREPKPKRPDEKARSVDAIDLWRRARSAREAAKGVASFAALSSNGAAFAQLQTNALAAELWRRAQDLEDAALAAWERARGEDGSRPPETEQTDDDADASTPRRR